MGCAWLPYNYRFSKPMNVFDNGAAYKAVVAKGGMRISGTGSVGGAIDLAFKTPMVSFLASKPII